MNASRREKSSATGGTFLRVIEIDAQGAGAHADTFTRIREGDLHGVIVHGVYSPAVVSDVVARLERHDPPFLETSFPAPFKSRFYGRNLNLTPPNLPGYFEEATRFHEHLASLFPPGLGLTTHLAGILSTLDHGRPFCAPPGPRPAERYMFTTLRFHLEGGFIPTHCDNEHALRPSYAHLMRLIQPHLLSFVLTLASPDDGGALEVFDRRLDPLARQIMNDDRAPAIDTTGVDSVRFRVPPGAMIVLDSGQYLHRVTPVIGPRTRWTACSFMALNRARDAMYCWG